MVDVEVERLLNEENDLKSVLEVPLDDVSDFLYAHFINLDGESTIEEKGCSYL